MPKYRNKFDRPSYVDHKIPREDESVLGTVRVKPTGILWKGANKQTFKRVAMDTFIEWINEIGAEQGQ